MSSKSRPFDKFILGLSLLSGGLFLLTLLGWPTIPGPYKYSITYFSILIFFFLLFIEPFLYYFFKKRDLYLSFLRQYARRLILAGATLLVLLIGEGTFRMLEISEWGGGEGPLQKNLRIDQYDFNQFGFRGPVITKEEMQNKKIVFGFGDSVLFGQGVSWKYTLLQQVEMAVNSQSKRKIKTLNFSLPGWNTKLETKFFFEQALRITQPDLFVLQYTLNDPESGLYFLKPLLPKKIEEVLRRSHLYFYLVRTYNAKKFPYEDHIESLYDENSEGWKSVRENIARLGKYCQNHDIPGIVVIYPILTKLEAYPLTSIHEKIQKEAEKAGLFTIDLLDSFQQQNEPASAFWVSKGDHHPNEKGHLLAAEKLTQTILNKL